MTVSTNSVDPSVLSSLGLSSASSSQLKNQTLSQDDFLRLMTAQLQNQDPLKPLDNSEFVSQMAQFSTVSGIQSLQSSFSSISSALTSNQALQASSLIGHSVLAPASSAALTSGGSISGAADLPVSGDAVLRVTDASGQIVRTLDLGTQAAGMTSFQWDGLDDNGTAAAAGTYNFSVAVSGSGGSQSATTYASGKVDSVALDSSGALTLKVNGVGNVAFGQVRQIS